MLHFLAGFRPEVVYHPPGDKSHGSLAMAFMVLSAGFPSPCALMLCVFLTPFLCRALLPWAASLCLVAPSLFGACIFSRCVHILTPCVLAPRVLTLCHGSIWRSVLQCSSLLFAALRLVLLGARHIFSPRNAKRQEILMLKSIGLIMRTRNNLFFLIKYKL